MMTHDWKRLAPHKPIDPGSSAYVARPGGGAAEIAAWILAGHSAVLLGGPAGIGKSSELAQAAALLEDERIACLVALDRAENMRELEPERLTLRLAGRLAHALGRARLSDHLHDYLVRESVLDGNTTTFSDGAYSSPRALLGDMLAQVARMEKRRVAFLIDGLEKAQPERATRLFEELVGLPDSVDVIVVVPWFATFGSRPDAIVRPGERFVAMRALVVEGDLGAAGRAFLRTVLTRRLGTDATGLEPDGTVTAVSDDANVQASKREIVEDAARWSGGVPRTFLQLLADAGTYARLRRGADWPDLGDLADAVSDQQDTYRRLLLPGDTDAIRANVGTDGRELELPRKVRLMAHGLILERMRERRPILEVHPLAQLAIEEGARRA